MKSRPKAIKCRASIVRSGFAVPLLSGNTFLVVLTQFCGLHELIHQTYY